jgi:glycosyltransferase involved in cell wall biosynthesis
VNDIIPFVVFGDEWGIHATSTQHLVRRFALNRPLLYVNTVGMRPPQLSLYDLRRCWTKLTGRVSARKPDSSIMLPGGLLYSPFMLPFNRPPTLRRWNRRRLICGLRRELDRHSLAAPVLLVSSPIGAEVIGSIGERLVVYYVTDNYAALPGVYVEYLEELERVLLAEADLIFVSSRSLQKDKIGRKTSPILLPHAVDFEHFHRMADPPGPIPAQLAHLPRPWLGFFGLLAPWVDFDLLERVAVAFPEGSVVLVGPAWSRSAPPARQPNLHWLGPRTYADLPRLAAHFDVGLIPFRQDHLTAYVNPLKLLEYLALGLPVVSTPLPDLDMFGDLVYQGRNPDEFVAQVRRAIGDRSMDRRKKRFERAAAESWEMRAKSVDDRIKEALQWRTTSRRA